MTEFLHGTQVYVDGRFVDGNGAPFDVDDPATEEVFTSVAAADAYTPMGGMKQSGIGRERGVAGLREYQEIQHVVVAPPAR